jgi:uncharacterized protein (DUF4415 family)
MAKTINKSEYIVRSLSKIKHKQWELYVVSRIVHLLNDLDIEFVCQQLVRKKNGGRYLVDLFFPQLGIYLEVDEKGHFEPNSKQLDKLRQREIWDASSLSEERISVYDERMKCYRDVTEINKDVDTFLDKLRAKKNKLLKFEPWDFEKRYDPIKSILKGYLDVKENVSLRHQVDVLNIFGAGYKGWQKGWWNAKGTNFGVWFPRLYHSREWSNELSEDGNTIIEQKSDKSLIEYEELGKTRIVFGHYSNELGQVVYKFVGVFQNDGKRTTPTKRVHKLVSNRIDIGDVTKLQ